jgi:hypothetical protein
VASSILKSVLVTCYARYHPWPVFTFALVLSIIGGLGAWLLPSTPIGSFGWWFSGLNAGIAIFLLFEPWRSNIRKRFFEERMEALAPAFEEVAEEHTQQLAHRLRERGLAVQVVQGELIFKQ